MDDATRDALAVILANVANLSEEDIGRLNDRISGCNLRLVREDEYNRHCASTWKLWKAKRVRSDAAKADDTDAMMERIREAKASMTWKKVWETIPGARERWNCWDHMRRALLAHEAARRV